MIVFISGMPRSGSTFTFNIAREVLGKWDSVHRESSTDLEPFLDRAKGKRHAIIKAHAANSGLLQGVIKGTVKSICTVRDPIEAMASYMDTFGLTADEAIRDMTSWLDMYACIKPHSLIVRYEDIEQHWATEAMRIAKYLDPNFRWYDVAEIAGRYSRAAARKISEKVRKGTPGTTDLGFSVVDDVTFLHRGHVSAESRPPEDRIGRDAIAKILDAFAGRMADFEHLRGPVVNRTSETGVAGQRGGLHRSGSDGATTRDNAELEKVDDLQALLKTDAPLRVVRAVRDVVESANGSRKLKASQRRRRKR
jgi:hypothetical protein